MSVESDIFGTLTALVGGRVYPDTAPNGAGKPFVTYQQVGGKPVAFLESGVVGVRNGRFQFNVWGTSRASVSALMRSIADTLVTSATLRAMPLTEPVADFDTTVDLYGATQDFSIWF